MIYTYSLKNVNSKKSSIEYLGLVISEGEVWMDPEKVEAVKN